METEIIKIRPGEGPVSEEDEEKLLSLIHI